MIEKPFSQACENNKAPIAEVLKHYFSGAKNIIEIGSGTGQHAVYFAETFPHLIWQTSDREVNIAGIERWIEEASLPNVIAPIILDVSRNAWPEERFDGVFSANTAHIMAWDEVVLAFAGVGGLLNEGGSFALYGPFNYDGQFTSDSNARFEEWLKSQGPHMGIRDFADMNKLAEENGLKLQADHEMPANNRLLVWKKA